MNDFGSTELPSQRGSGVGASGDGAGGDSGSSPVVTARGTYEGVILRIDCRASGDTTAVVDAVRKYIDGRRGFLSGNPVIIEWAAEIPSDEVSSKITSLLRSDFSIEVVRSGLVSERPNVPAGSRAKSSAVFFGSTKGVQSSSHVSSSPGTMSSSFDSEKSNKSRSLFDGLESFGETAEERPAGARGGLREMKVDSRSGLQGDVERTAPVANFSASVGRTSASKGVDYGAFDDPDARIVYGTLRSGERVESEHSVIVFGDVNPGAEIVAGGDIVVLGVLRGIAHAGAYEESGGGRVILAMNLQPTQLRIGSIISRGGGEVVGCTPEIARVEANAIMVAPYSSRQMANRRR